MLSKSFSWSSFAKAYLRENTNWEQTQFEQQAAIKITLDKSYNILLPIHYFSEVGIHHFTGEILLNDVNSSAPEVITFEQALHLLLPHTDKITVFSRHQIASHFNVQWQHQSTNQIYAVNAGLSSHGIAEPQLSLMAWRSAKIINHLAGKNVFDLSETQNFIDWTLPKSTRPLTLTTAV